MVTTDPELTASARRLVERELATVDRAASRFRADSEIVALAAVRRSSRAGQPLLAELVTVALRAAADTDGAVDPTLGAQLAALGYDRDITLVTAARAAEHARRVTVVPRADWRDVRLDGL